jgi:hypothetical protein
MEKEMRWMKGYKRALRATAVCSFVFCMATAQSWAWGREGHRLTALVAEQYLTPQTKAQVALLLKNESLADVAPWADSYRNDHPETAPWHFVDIPLAEEKFDRTRDCPISKSDAKSPWRDCITDRILFFEGRLGDASLSTQERAFALKFLVHLMGDIHQPFHALGDARGGNDIAVSFLGSSRCDSYHCNLHAVWDDMLIEEQGLSEKKYTERLLKEIEENHWERMSGGEPTTWANISHHYAVQAMMPNGALITREYVDEESKIVDAQLALGGLRLARVLNRILGAAAATPTSIAPTLPPAVTSQPR